METNIQRNNPIILINRIGKISQNLKGSQLKGTVINKQISNLRIIAKFLEITESQAMIFSLILTLGFEHRTVGINDIAKYLGCNPVMISNYMSDLEILEDKRLVRIESEGKKRRAMIHEISYFITRDVLDSVYKEDKCLLCNQKSMDMVDFLEEVNKLVEDRDNEKITYSELVEDIANLIETNKQEPFIAKIHRFSLDDEEQMLLLYVASETFNGSDEVDLGYACDKIYDNPRTKFFLKRGLVNGSYELIQKNLIKLQDGRFRSDRDVLLTEYALNHLFEENVNVLLNSGKDRNLITPQSLKHTKLYYNPEENNKIEFLSRILKQRNYNSLIKRIKENDMKSGLTILLYGEPGTGKTETVYQMARISNRPIMRVEISDTKSMWFGESEKRIKGIFDTYKRILINPGNTPILLFNEADGILGKRKSAGVSPVDQTENAIQNIILQEMEEFEGIFIATTNLTTNLDKAFDRRFLFKIEFGRPSESIRIKIWKDKISALAQMEAKCLGKYELSGAQIDNIARKYFLDKLLCNRTPGLDELKSYCIDEANGMRREKKIGF